MFFSLGEQRKYQKFCYLDGLIRIRKCFWGCRGALFNSSQKTLETKFSRLMHYLVLFFLNWKSKGCTNNEETGYISHWFETQHPLFCHLCYYVSKMTVSNLRTITEGALTRSCCESLSDFRLKLPSCVYF